MIKVSSLNFSYNRKSGKILKNINLKIEDGESIAIVGHNGAGKTTLVKLIIGFLNSKSGEVKISSDIIKQRQDIYYLPNENDLFKNMTLYQNLKFKKLLFNYKKVDIVQNELVDEFHFRKNLNKKISEMSSGMAKISSLICGLLFQPKLIILDEPTNSIDFHSKNMLESFLLKFKDGKNTIINVSHDLDYVYNVSDRFVIIDNGEIVHDVPKRNFQNIEDFKKEYLEWTKTNE